MDRNVKYLIIGAGISGLTFANYADGDYLIIEKEKEVGGYCRTIKKKDYVWDYAGHFFHFSTDEFKKKFLDSVNPEDIKYKDKNTKIIYKGELVDYPFQTNIHQLEKEEFIDCLYDLFHKEEKEDYDSFLDMLYGKFGKSIVEKFLKPYNEKLYAVDLKTLDKDAMGRFFPYADIPAIIDNMKANKDSTSYNNSFLYPRNGAGSFIQILYDALDSSKILMEHEVVKIDNEHKVAQLDDGSKINYEYLINTSPLNHFLGYFEGEKFSALKNRLSYNKVLVFNLGFNKKSKFTEEHWMYIPDKAVNLHIATELNHVTIFKPSCIPNPVVTYFGFMEVGFFSIHRILAKTEIFQITTADYGIAAISIFQNGSDVFIVKSVIEHVFPNEITI